MFLRYIGQNKNYGLKKFFVYPCKVYTKNNYIWVKARDYGLSFPRKYVRIPYDSIESIYYDWTSYNIERR